MLVEGGQGWRARSQPNGSSLARSVPTNLPWRSFASAILLCALIGVAPSGRVTAPSRPVSPAVTPHNGPSTASLIAKAAISTALGADNPSYRVRRSHTGLVAVNPAQ